jgi:cysteinylglycine-S-conjugate dipeptidase
MHEDLKAAIDSLFPEVRAGLESLVRIPSVSAPGYPTERVWEAAEATRALLVDAGVENATFLETDGAPPAVFGEVAGPIGAPSVLLYAHYDVQPPGPNSEWTTPPFEPVERDGRLHGRGASDDKAGLMGHIAALTVHRGAMPVTVKVIVEGEEEIGSPHLGAFIERYAERLAADVIVIADSSNWRVGEPALTTSLRGLVDCIVEVRTLEQGVHSGMFGGPLPDALTTLARLLATLHAPDGTAAVRGLTTAVAPALDLSEAELREQAHPVDGVQLIGQGSIAARIWAQPAISVLAIDAPPVAEAINQLVPMARAKISVRLAPGDDPDRALAALEAHLHRHAPWGAHVTVTPGARAQPFALGKRAGGYAAFAAGMREAWGRDAVEMGVGGTIPFVAALQEAFPDAEVLLTGVGDPLSRWHGPDESQDLVELKRGCLAEAIALRLLGGAGD